MNPNIKRKKLKPGPSCFVVALESCILNRNLLFVSFQSHFKKTGDESKLHSYTCTYMYVYITETCLFLEQALHSHSSDGVFRESKAKCGPSCVDFVLKWLFMLNGVRCTSFDPHTNAVTSDLLFDVVGHHSLLGLHNGPRLLLLQLTDTALRHPQTQRHIPVLGRVYNTQHIPYIMYIVC